MVKFRILGSGLNRPIEGRHLTSILVNFDGDRFLFDCPENVQVQLQRHGGSMDLKGIFLTGLRPETTFGIPGLLTTLKWLSTDENNLDDLNLYIPDIGGGRKYAEKLVSLGTLDLNIIEVGMGETIMDPGEFTLSTFPTNSGNKGPTLGYRLEENEQRGRFDREKAEELGVPVGPKFGKLHDGNSVELDDGRTIHPEQVVGSPRPGRSLAYTGATEYLEQIPENIQNVDILFVDGGSSTRGGQEEFPGHMNAYEAGTIAGAADASMIILTHVRPVFSHSFSRLVDDITAAYDGPYLIGEDGVRGVIAIHDINEEVLGLHDVLSQLEGHHSVDDFPK